VAASRLELGTERQLDRALDRLVGQRWRVRRSWVSAAIVAGALCLEPVARWVSGQLMPPAPVWTVEVVSGAVVAIVFASSLLTCRRATVASDGPA